MRDETRTEPKSNNPGEVTAEQICCLIDSGYQSLPKLRGKGRVSKKKSKYLPAESSGKSDESSAS